MKIISDFQVLAEQVAKYRNIFVICCDNAVNLDTATEHFLEEQPTGEPGRDPLGEHLLHKRHHVDLYARYFEKSAKCFDACT